MIEFNINEAVQVKLTDTGIAELKQQHEAFYKDFPEWRKDFVPPTTDAQGWSTWQLHALMSRFGSHITMGSELPFETTIRLDIKPEEIKP